jgi:hypothetical protein
VKNKMLQKSEYLLVKDLPSNFTSDFFDGILQSVLEYSHAKVVLNYTKPG